MIPAEQTAEMMAVTRILVQPGHLSSGDTVILTPGDTEGHAGKLIVNVTIPSSQCHTRIMTGNTIGVNHCLTLVSPLCYDLSAGHNYAVYNQMVSQMPLTSNVMMEPGTGFVRQRRQGCVMYSVTRHRVCLGRDEILY